MPSCDDQTAVFSERVWSRRTKSHYASCWNRRTWTLLREMRSCFDKTRMCVWIWNLKHVRASHLASDLGAGRRMRSRCWSVEKSQSVLCPRKPTGKKSNFRIVATGSCLTLSSFGNKKKLRKKRMTVLNTMSYSRCVICRSGGLEHWASAFFFSSDIFFFPRARVGLVKKSDEKHRKKSSWPNWHLFQNGIHVIFLNKAKERNKLFTYFASLVHFQIRGGGQMYNSYCTVNQTWWLRPPEQCESYSQSLGDRNPRFECSCDKSKHKADEVCPPSANSDLHWAGIAGHACTMRGNEWRKMRWVPLASKPSLLVKGAAALWGGLWFFFVVVLATQNSSWVHLSPWIVLSIGPVLMSNRLLVRCTYARL